MYCTKCGTENSENAWKCTNCGSVLQQEGTALQQPPIKIPNYLAQAILSTLCCCLPFGIPAIVFAAQVNSKIGAGDIAGAMESSRKAKMWCWIAFGVGLPLQIIALILQITWGVLSQYAH
jgi:hypothetical protein